MAKKLVSMTAEEIVEVYGADEEKIVAMAETAPEYKADLNPGGKVVARGFAQFREYINRKGRPKAESRKVKISIRLPEETVASLRKVNGYSTILGDYIMGGIKSGLLEIPTAHEPDFTQSGKPSPKGSKKGRSPL